MVFWDQDDLRRRLRRIEGQVRGIEGMVGRTASCQEILVQLAATQGALAKVVKIVEACRVAETLTDADVAESGDLERVQTAIHDLLR